LIFGDRKKIVFSQSVKKAALINNELTMPAKYYEECLGGMKYQYRAQEAVKKFLSGLAAQHLKERADFFSQKIGLPYQGLRITNARTLWGTCTLGGVLSFNLRAVMLPEREIDYLVIHEICHLKHMNHSADFWSKVNQFCPDYKKIRASLKQKGYLLSIFN